MRLVSQIWVSAQWGLNRESFDKLSYQRFNMLG